MHDDEFLKQYTLPNANSTSMSYGDGTETAVDLNKNEYIPEAGDITEDDGIGNKKYITSSLEMGTLNMNNDETQIDIGNDNLNVDVNNTNKN